MFFKVKGSHMGLGGCGFIGYVSSSLMLECVLMFGGFMNSPGIALWPCGLLATPVIGMDVNHFGGKFPGFGCHKLPGLMSLAFFGSP